MPADMRFAVVKTHFPSLRTEVINLQPELRSADRMARMMEKVHRGQREKDGSFYGYGVRRLPKAVDITAPDKYQQAERLLWPHLFEAEEGVA